MLIYRGEKSLLVYLKKTSNVFLKSNVRSFEHTLKLTWNVRYNMMGYPRLSMERDENTRHIIPCRGAFYMHLGRASGSISNCSSYWCHLTTLQTVSVGADIFDLCIISFSLLFSFLPTVPSTIHQKCTWTISEALLHLALILSDAPKFTVFSYEILL